MSDPQTQEKEPPQDLAPGPFGQFLALLQISTKRLPDSLGIETIELAGKDLVSAMKHLRESKDTELNYLLTVSGVEQPDSFDSVYHLWSYTNKKELVIKVRVAKSAIQQDKLPVVPSIASDWQAANWHERETYDLVGIHYDNHPYLRRILNPWDWEGYPLRRDYKQPVDALNDKNPHSMR